MAKNKKTKKNKKQTKGKVDMTLIMKAQSREINILPPNKKEIDRKKQNNKKQCRGKVNY